MKFLVRNLIAILAAAILASIASTTLAKDDTSAIAEAFLGRWTETVVVWRTEEVVAMHASNTLFYGSAPELRTGTQGVTGYLQALAKGGVTDVEFHVNFTGTPKVFEYRIILTLVKSADGNWLIAGHFAAPKRLRHQHRHNIVSTGGIP